MAPNDQVVLSERSSATPRSTVREETQAEESPQVIKSLQPDDDEVAALSAIS